MPNTTQVRTPSYRLHKPSGQAVVTLNGRDHYLGKHGTKASKERHERLIGEWLANGRQLPTRRQEQPSASVTELIAAYWPFVESHYRRADGTPTSEVKNNRLALRGLRRLYSETPVAEFGPLALKALREDMITSGLSRSTINGHVGRIKRLFRWGVENEVVPPSVHQALAAVRGLQAGRSDARETKPVRPVSPEHVEKVLPHLSPPVAAIVKLLMHTGMRVGEAVTMRMRDLDRTGTVWTYCPPHHKTAYRGTEKVIDLGPKAQAVLRPFLTADPDAHLFRPAVWEALRHAARKEARQTPMTPSQRKRRRKGNPKRTPGDCYGPEVIGRAISRACEKAGVPHWHPHQIRHTVATQLRREHGVEIARVILGHSSPATTEIYAEIDRTKAREIMARVG